MRQTDGEDEAEQMEGSGSGNNNKQLPTMIPYAGPLLQASATLFFFLFFFFLIGFFFCPSFLLWGWCV
jgi:hypothetical protein